MMTALYESPRLQFRLWRQQDLPLAQRLWTNRQVCRYITDSGAMTPRQAGQRMELEISQYLQTGLQYHPLFRKEDGAFIGVCGLRPYQAKDPARQGQKICEIGVHLLPDYWHAGYATEAARRTMERAFELGFDALFAGHNPKNTPSRGLLLKLGFQYDHDEFYPPTGLYHPSYFLDK